MSNLHDPSGIHDERETGECATKRAFSRMKSRASSASVARDWASVEAAGPVNLIGRSCDQVHQAGATAPVLRSDMRARSAAESAQRSGSGGCERSSMFSKSSWSMSAFSSSLRCTPARSQRLFRRFAWMPHSSSDHEVSQQVRADRRALDECCCAVCDAFAASLRARRARGAQNDTRARSNSIPGAYQESRSSAGLRSLVRNGPRQRRLRHRTHLCSCKLHASFLRGSSMN